MQRADFLILQQLSGIKGLRASLRQLPAAKPVLGLYEQGRADSRRNSAALRGALRRGNRQVQVLKAGEAGSAVTQWLGVGG